MAFVLPILLVVVMGMVDFGLYLYNDLQLTHIARDAARYVSVHDLASAEAIRTDVLATRDGSPNPSSPHLISMPDADIELPAADSLVQGESFSVTASGTYQFITPIANLILQLFSEDFPSTLTIQSTAVMRYE